MSTDGGPDDEFDGPHAVEPDITRILSGLASSRITAGPAVYADVISRIGALEPMPASRANLPGLARIEVQLDARSASDIGAALIEVGGAIADATVAMLAWADQRGEVDITLVEQGRDVTLQSVSHDPYSLTLDAGGVFAHLMIDDPVQVALMVHWFLDRERSRHRRPRPGEVVLEEYGSFATGLGRVVTHASSTRQKVVLDVQFHADGRRLVGLKTTYAEAPDRARRRRRS